MAEILKTKKDYKSTDFINYSINKWLKSDVRKEMETGKNYYSGKHDILTRGKLGFTRVGQDSGSVFDVESSAGDSSCATEDNLPDNRLVDNRYAGLVDQKSNYLLGQPPVFSTDSDDYSKKLKETLNSHFNRTLRNVCSDSLNCAVGWMYVWIDEDKKLKFKRLDPLEIIPFWTDDEENELECVIRVYTVEVIDPDSKNTESKKETRVEVYLPSGVDSYVYDGDLQLRPTVKDGSYIKRVDENGNSTEAYSWDKVPIIGFRYNPEKIPLVRRVKTLQDGLNEIFSFFMNNMQEDARSTIFVLKNYGGQSGAEFKKWLMESGVVNVTTLEGADGGVDILHVDVNAENYGLLLQALKRAIIENGRGYDAKDINSGGDPNEMNLKSMYIDIDLDANMMETEYQASFEDLIILVNKYLTFAGKGNFDNVPVSIILNRDTIVDEQSIVNMVTAVTGIVSQETQVEQLPFIRDSQKEMKRIADEEAKRREDDDMFKSMLALKEPPAAENGDDE